MLDVKERHDAEMQENEFDKINSFLIPARKKRKGDEMILTFDEQESLTLTRRK